jgi:aspartate/glutamate racemase
LGKERGRPGKKLKQLWRAVKVRMVEILQEAVAEVLKAIAKTILLLGFGTAVMAHTKLRSAVANERQGVSVHSGWYSSKIVLARPRN